MSRREAELHVAELEYGIGHAQPNNLPDKWHYQQGSIRTLNIL